MPSKKKYKIVEVTWFDAQSSMESWTAEEIEQNLEPLFTRSIGYLVVEKKDYIVLGFCIFGNELIKHHQCIPRGMIKKMKPISI